MGTKLALTEADTVHTSHSKMEHSHPYTASGPVLGIHSVAKKMNGNRRADDYYDRNRASENFINGIQKPMIMAETNTLSGQRQGSHQNFNTPLLFKQQRGGNTSENVLVTINTEHKDSSAFQYRIKPRTTIEGAMNRKNKNRRALSMSES